MKEKFDSNEYIFRNTLKYPHKQHKDSLCGNDFIKKVENSAELLQLNDNPKA
ncbi:hypothetical protein KVE08_06985 [Helicobacter pylori]|nr:hypothetical protein KVE08_06985 [Helicobacter pylori]